MTFSNSCYKFISYPHFTIISYLLLRIVLERSTRKRTIAECFSAKYEQKGQQHRKLVEAVADFLCEDGKPISTVQGSGFKKMMEAFDPR